MVANFSSLERLLASGDPDFSFPTVFFDRPPRALCVLRDGRILVGGEFTTVNGETCPPLVRLLPDGSLDLSFKPDLTLPEGFPAGVWAISVTEGGGLLLACDFGSAGYRVLQLAVDGKLDARFVNLPLSHAPTTLIEQLDGGVLLAGPFQTVNGVPRPGIARLVGDRPVITWLPPASNSGGPVRLVTRSQPGATYVLQSSSDLVHWTEVATQVATGCTLQMEDPGAAVAAASAGRFYRVQRPGAR